MINATGNRMTAEIRRQSNLANAIAETQIQISSRKRIQQASDDPVASSRIAVLRQVQANEDAWSTNVSLASSLTAQADTTLQSTSDILARAKELMVAGASGNTSALDRATMAIELRDIADQLDSYQNTTTASGQLLFQTGTAMEIRLDKDVVMAPVPARNELFSVGGVNISQIVRDAATALESGNATQINTSLTAVSAGIDKIADSAAQIGLNATKIDRISEAFATRKIDVAAERSALEDTDLTTAIAELNAQTITLEAAQAAFARINRRTLFDILS